MNISKQYREEVLQQLLVKFLLGGHIPSPEEIMLRYKQIQTQYPQLGNRPLLSQNPNRLIPRQAVSLEDFESVVMEAKLDLKVLRSNLLSSYRELLNTVSLWRSYYAAAQSKLIDINNELSLRLFLNQDSEGFFTFVSDDFKSVDKVDSNLTTAEVHTGAGFVKITGNQNRTYRQKYNPSEASARFVGSVGSGLTSVITIAGTNIANIVNEDSAGWIGVSYGPEPKTATLSIVVQLSEPREMNRVVFERIRRESGAGTIECYYTSDRVNWGRFGATRSLGDPAVFTNEKVSVKELRFNITKTDYDMHRVGEGYIYYFDCKEVAMYSDAADYSVGIGNELISIEHEVPSYGKAAIEVCEANTKDTNIKYYLSHDGVYWSEVNPSNKAPNAIDYVVNFSSNNQFQNIDGPSIDGARSNVSLIRVSDYAHLSIPMGEVALLNYRIPSSVLSSVPIRSMRLFENYKTAPSSNTIEGWKDNGETLSCSFYVDSSEPIDLDFGPYTVTLDGTTSAGLLSVKGVGWHRIEVPKEAYSFTDGGAINLADLHRKDPLYPYNAKNIIEGYQYDSGYVGPRIYTGFSMRAAIELERSTSLKQFASNMNRYFYPSLDRNGDMVFLLKRPEDLNAFSSNTYYLSYNKTDSTFNRIYFKALLESANPEVTPLLMSYTIKMGF